MNTKAIKIQLLRNFHWLLAIFFALVWLSGDDWMQMHSFAGYGILAISIIFILKQFLNGQFFKCSKPSLEFKWLKSNLLLMILVSLLLAGISGILADSSGKDIWEDLHEVFANITLLVVGSHIILKFLNRFKNKTMTKQYYKQRGYNFMNNSIVKKSYDWLLTKWQNVTTLWNQNSGKNLLLRGALVTVSLIYVVLISSVFLAILPVILVSAVLLALLVKSDVTKHVDPVTINVKPETNQ